MYLNLGPNLPREYSGLEFPCMSLQLISVLINTSKEIGATVYIQHDPLALFFVLHSLRIMGFHFDPFST